MLTRYSFDEIKSSYADIAKANHNRFTSLSKEIELLKNYMAELVRKTFYFALYLHKIRVKQK